jgi:hypothetical protein
MRGQDPQRCTCHLPAGWGSPTPGLGACKIHGGCTPNHVASVTERQAKAAAEKFGLLIKTTGRQALADELARSNGVVEFYRARLMELPPDELVFGLEKRVITTGTPPAGQQSQSRWRNQGQPGMEVTQAARPHPYLTLYASERKHLAAVAVEMERLGIEKRMVTIAEQQAVELKRVMDAIFGDAELGLTPEQRATLPAVVPRHLRALGAADG